MSGQSNGRVVANPWQALRAHTPARIALGRAGGSLPTSPQLAFQLAHAQARDAVHRPLDVEALLADLAPLGLSTLALHSAAVDRPTYLQRPDLGRRLDEASRARLLAADEQTTTRNAAVLTAMDAAGATDVTDATDGSTTARPAETPDLVFVVADGLSALAVQRHAAPLIAAVLPRLQAVGEDGSPPWRIAPVVVVGQGRVAVGDDVGGALGAGCVVVLIGERPGLSSPDSLGLYLTWSPRPGRTDAQRNCISNVRPEGLPIDEAADQLVRLLTLARARGLTGVALKDDREAAPALTGLGPRPAFLLGD